MVGGVWDAVLLNQQAAEDILHDLIDAMDDGEVVIYPTETLYALGCDATNEAACNSIFTIKGRSKAMPLPLIVGGTDMLSLVTDERPAALNQLADAFWPGPLSILVKALPSLPSVLSDNDGYTSVRWSGHPFAAELSRRMRLPLVATSANVSGKPAAAMPEQVDPELLEKVGAFYSDPPWPKGGEASTVVRLISATRLEVLREGAISVEMLCDKGFTVSLSA